MRERKTPCRRICRARWWLSLPVIGAFALALGLHAAAQTPPAHCVGENLLPNPGFESGVHAWYVAGSVAPTTFEVQSGAAAVRLGAPISDGYMDRRIDPVVGATYTLSGWGKLSSGGEQATIGVSFYDANGERLSAAEPAPLLFTSTTFVEQQLTFTVPAGVSEMDVYLVKASGATQFVADSLSLTLCQAGSPVAATPLFPPSAATPIAAALATPRATVTGAAASPTSSEPAPLVEYVDPDLDFTVGYPSGWRRLTEDEIRARLGAAGNDEVANTLATTRLVAISPDGQAAVALTALPRSSHDEALAAVAQAVAAADAGKVLGSGELTTETVSLAGRAAISLSFSADDAAGERLIRQLVTLDDVATIVLAFVVRRDAAPAYDAIFQQIAASWRWEPRP